MELDFRPLSPHAGESLYSRLLTPVCGGSGDVTTPHGQHTVFTLHIVHYLSIKYEGGPFTHKGGRVYLKKAPLNSNEEYFHGTHTWQRLRPPCTMDVIYLFAYPPHRGG